MPNSIQELDLGISVVSLISYNIDKIFIVVLSIFLAMLLAKIFCLLRPHIYCTSFTDSITRHYMSAERRIKKRNNFNTLTVTFHSAFNIRTSIYPSTFFDLKFYHLMTSSVPATCPVCFIQIEQLRFLSP